MNKKYYTDERAVQIILYLLKANGIKKIVASPGTTNITFVGSVQQDPWFEVYSSVDERSAAYIACGLAEQSREPVVLTCTGKWNCPKLIEMTEQKIFLQNFQNFWKNRWNTVE